MYLRKEQKKGKLENQTSWLIPFLTDILKDSYIYIRTGRKKPSQKCIENIQIRVKSHFNEMTLEFDKSNTDFHH